MKTPLTPLKDSHRFMLECLVKAGVSKAHAKIMANTLVEADYRGVYSHGMNRLEMYIREVQSGLSSGKAVPRILKQTASTAWVNGNNGLGPVVGNFCMNLAMKKAKKSGVGWVVAKGSNHYGIGAIYSSQATRLGLIGITASNTSPLMAPTRARDSALGTNPWSVAAPGTNDDTFVLDIATTAVAVGKIEMYKRMKKPLPKGWALNADGQVETNADVALESKRLLPLGGTEMNGGYKGTGLGMMVEIFSGISGGSAYGPNIRKWGEKDKKANLGQFFAAVDPGCFAPGFRDRMSDLMNYMRKMKPADPKLPVIVPGDMEKKHKASVDKIGGLQYVEDMHNTCKKLAKEFGVRPLVAK